MNKKPIDLSTTQLVHLIYGAMKNLVDLKVTETKDGVEFLLILDCLDSQKCIPATKEPESEEEVLDIAEAYMAYDLYDFFKTVATVKTDDGRYFRSFDLIKINKNNISQFVECLSILDDLWINLDQKAEEEDILENSIKGKNFVQGNGTIN